MKRGFLIFFLLITILPLAAGLSYALLYSLGLVGIMSDGFTLAFWSQVIFKNRFWTSITYSAYIAFFGLIVSVLFGGLIALNISAKGVSRTTASSLYIPLAFPPIVAGFIFFLLFIDSGFFSRLIFYFGLSESIAQFPDFVGGNAGLATVIAHVFLATPFFALLFANTYANERLHDLESLGTTLGARTFQNLRLVVIPVLLRSNRTAIMLYFIFMLGAYEIPLILGSQSLRMISVLTIDTMTRFNLESKPLAYAYAVFFTFIVLLLTFLGLRFKMKRT